MSVSGGWCRPAIIVGTGITALSESHEVSVMVAIMAASAIIKNFFIYVDFDAKVRNIPHSYQNKSDFLLRV